MYLQGVEGCIRCGLADAAAMFVVPVMCTQPLEWQVVEKLGGARLEVMNPDSGFLRYQWEPVPNTAHANNRPGGDALDFGMHWQALLATAAWRTPLHH